MAARSQAELAALMPTPSSPVADTEGVLRDRFLDGAGTGPDLVLIPTGRFQMGSPEHERKKAMEAGSQKNWLDRETPQHWVGIEQPIAMGRYPGDGGRVARVRRRPPAGSRRANSTGPRRASAQGDDHPVVGVTWNDAQQYLRWLQRR